MFLNFPCSFKSDNPCVKKLIIKDCQFLDEGAVAIQFVGGVSSTAKLGVVEKVKTPTPPPPKEPRKPPPRIIKDKFINAVIKKDKSHTWENIEIDDFGVITEKAWHFQPMKLTYAKIDENERKNVKVSSALQHQGYFFKSKF